MWKAVSSIHLTIGRRPSDQTCHMRHAPASASGQASSGLGGIASVVAPEESPRPQDHHQQWDEAVAHKVLCQQLSRHSDKELTQ